MKTAILICHLITAMGYAAYTQDIDDEYQLVGSGNFGDTYVRYLDSTFMYYSLYSPEGELVKTAFYRRKDSMEYLEGPTLFYQNGRVYLELFYKNDTAVRTAIRYFPNGDISVVSRILSDTSSKNTRFYENGNIKSIGKTIYGSEIGIWLYYHPNGMLEKTGNYVALEVCVETFSEYRRRQNHPEIAGRYISMKQGSWKYYDENGVLIRTETYGDDFNLIETIER